MILEKFDYHSPESLSQASAMLAELKNAAILAGGTDLLGLMKRGLAQPDHLVSLSKIAELRKVEVGQNGNLRIGSASRLSDIQNAGEIADGWPLLVDAISTVASPQIRNVATIGGNLCQSPRCRYYRHGDFMCSRLGGSACYAAMPSGNNRYHSIFGGAGCVAAFPSDLAPVLIAMGAVFEIATTNAIRRVEAESFYILPKKPQFNDTILGRGDILIRIEIPDPKRNAGYASIKVADRRSIDFSNVSIAAVAECPDGLVQTVRIVAGGVAPIPVRLTSVEEKLIGKFVTQIDAAHASESAARDASPLKGNYYKIDLLKKLTEKAISTALNSG